MANSVPVIPLSLLLLASAAIAQSVPLPAAQFGTHQPDLTGIQRTASGLTGGAGRLAGFGADYAVEFDAAGMHFQPALGAAAAADQLLHVGFVGITCGGVEVPTELVAAPGQSGPIAVYRRSAAVEERYEVRAEGVEHSFVFTALPRRGDLVVRCRLGGELAPFAAAAADGGLQFLVPGLGGATLGNVTGIDAHGDRCQGAVRLVDGQLELSLPAAFVDAAALPLVLDPLVGARIDVALGGTNDTEPSVAYLGASTDYLVVWRQVLSATSTSVLGRTWRPGTGLGTAQVLGTGPVIRRPRVVSHNLADRWLVVWERAGSALGASVVASRVVNSDQTLGPAADLTPAGSSCVEVDVSGNAAVDDNVGILVWREVGVGIRAMVYSLPSGTQGVTTLAPFLVSGDPTAREPRINKAGSGTRVIVFGRLGAMEAQACAFPGVLVGNPYVFSVRPTHLPRVDVDGANGSFLVLCDQPAFGRADLDISALQLNLVGNQMQFGSMAGLATSTADDFGPRVALLGPKYLAVWSRTVGFLDYEVRGTSVGLTNCTVCGAEFTVAGTLTSDIEPMIGAQRGGGSLLGGAMVVWASHMLTAELRGDVHAIQFAASAATPTQALWSGCGRPVTIAATSSLSLGNSAFTYAVSSSDLTAGLAFVSLGLGTTPLTCGGCSFVGPTALSVIPLASGQGSHPLAIPCAVGLLATQIDAQAAILGVTTNFCSLASRLSTSNAIRLVIGE